ncbi:LytR/AlgR family response regulator transcription factor [Vibrio sp. SCSIO 43137]|uniref:LytR/AlgR family response regulator transcription factor n=1 Tax=Vibrio sp. SCSIO 43137 TaxID=3021011 RepID=UPI00230701D9|nr:LytTR family DNA-binding domain-containing protein [Vibrio sp. SCSIO 43137]WCE32212.1 LytTR family DNA-binding domain-containing protein [Vibrio sp. SCSIO 43137]
MVRKVIIVDDEPAARRQLSAVVKQTGGMEIVGEAGDAHSAIQLINNKRPDIVFLDIEMPGADGFSVADSTDDYPYHLVFCTAYQQYALNAFSTRAVDYLMKPVRPERLQQCLNKIANIRQTLLNEAQLNNESLTVSDGSKNYLLSWKSIAYIEGIGRYRRLHLTRIGVEEHQVETIVTDMSLDDFCQKLPGNYFIRIHRSYIVNISDIVMTEVINRQTYITLKSFNDLKLPVSRSQFPNLKSRINL